MTIDPKFFELIQADIDGEIDATGKAELENFLAESEEGRASLRELEPSGLVQQAVSGGARR